MRDSLFGGKHRSVALLLIENLDKQTLGAKWYVVLYVHISPCPLGLCAAQSTSERSSSPSTSLLQALPGQTVPEGVPHFKLVLVGDGGTGAPSCTLSWASPALAASIAGDLVPDLLLILQARPPSSSAI